MQRCSEIGSCWQTVSHTRVFAAGWSEHNRCILCLHNIVQADLGKTEEVSRAITSGSNGTQARAWCSLEGVNTINCSNSNGCSSSDVLVRPVIASAAAEAYRTEQQEKAKAVLATADQISRAQSEAPTTGSGNAKPSR